MDDTFKIKHAQYGSISQLSRPHFLHIFLVTEGEFVALKNTTFHHFKVGDIFISTTMNPLNKSLLTVV